MPECFERVREAIFKDFDTSFFIGASWSSMLWLNQKIDLSKAEKSMNDCLRGSGVHYMFPICTSSEDECVCGIFRVHFRGDFGVY